jgi:hypothetical protein
MIRISQILPLFDFRLGGVESSLQHGQQQQTLLTHLVQNEEQPVPIFIDLIIKNDLY